MSKCFVRGCLRPTYGRGMCRNHYTRLARGRPNWSPRVARRLSCDEAESVRQAFRMGTPRKQIAAGFGISSVAVWYITAGQRHEACR